METKVQGVLISTVAYPPVSDQAARSGSPTITLFFFRFPKDLGENEDEEDEEEEEDEEKEENEEEEGDEDEEEEV